MMLEAAAGGVVYCHGPTGDLHIALILDKHGNWGLPKGHLDGDETPLQAAHREIWEETGLHCTMGRLVQRIEYPIPKRGEQRLKRVDYFLAQSQCTTLTPATEEGIRQAEWLLPDEAVTRLTYANVREVLQRGLEMLAQGQPYD